MEHVHSLDDTWSPYWRKQPQLSALPIPSNRVDLQLSNQLAPILSKHSTDNQQQRTSIHQSWKPKRSKAIVKFCGAALRSNETNWPTTNVSSLFRWRLIQGRAVESSASNSVIPTVFEVTRQYISIDGHGDNRKIIMVMVHVIQLIDQYNHLNCNFPDNL